MKLLYGPLSMFSAKVRIAIGEKRLDCEYEAVPFNLRERYTPKHPEVSRCNPKGQIPVLIDDGIVVYDSTQIFEYLEDVHPSPPLWPNDKRLKAEARRLELEADELFFPHVVTLIENIYTPNPEAVELAKDEIQVAYGRLEGQLSGQDFLVGHYTYADIATICALYFAAFLGADLPQRCERGREWQRRIVSRHAVQLVLQALNDFLIDNGLNAPTTFDVRTI